MHAVALTARKLADFLLLISAFEIEGRCIGARIDLALAEINYLIAAGNLFPNGLLGVVRIARLIDIAKMHGFADFDRAGVRLLLADDHAEERGFARAIGADHADNAAGRQLEGEIVDQQPVAKALREMREVDDIVAKPLGDRNDDLRGCGRLLILLGDEFLIALDAGLGFGLARLRARCDPFGFGFELALAGLLLAALLGEALLFLLQPGGIIALIGNPAPAIELEDPACDIVEEIAVVGNNQDRAGIGAQM